MLHACAPAAQLQQAPARRCEPARGCPQLARAPSGPQRCRRGAQGRLAHARCPSAGPADAQGEPCWLLSEEPCWLLIMLQVFRTEHWARQLGNDSSLSLMAVGKRTLPAQRSTAQCACLPGPGRLGPARPRRAAPGPTRAASQAPPAAPSRHRLTRSVPAAPVLPPAVLTTTMLFSAAAAGAAHPDALASILHHPGTGISMLTSSNIPWHQVCGWAGGRAPAGACQPCTAQAGSLCSGAGGLPTGRPPCCRRAPPGSCAARSAAPPTRRLTPPPRMLPAHRCCTAAF